jgi:hypothetical protein
MPNQNLFKSARFRSREGARANRQTEREARSEVISATSFNPATNQLITANFEPLSTAPSPLSYHDPSLFGPAVTAIVDVHDPSQSHTTLDVATPNDDSLDPDEEHYDLGEMVLEGEAGLSRYQVRIIIHRYQRYGSADFPR